MIKLYGSPMCPDCAACKTGLDLEKTEYEYVDITASLANLKEFLKLRDTLPLYEKVKEAGGIGIPTLILEDGTVTLDYASVLQKEYASKTKTACRLDGKGC